MKIYSSLSKIILALCFCGISLALVNCFTGSINSAVSPGGSAVCIAGFIVAGLVTVILEAHRT